MASSSRPSLVSAVNAPPSLIPHFHTLSARAPDAQPAATAKELILSPVTTLEGHEPWKSPLSRDNVEVKNVWSISYFPDGRQMISGSRDQTIRRWDLQKGKEIEEARDVCDKFITAVGVSRNGRWAVTAGSVELKVNEVETGIVRTFHEGKRITCIDISSDSALLAGGTTESKIWIWRSETCELMAGSFELSYSTVAALRFSGDSRKLAVLADEGKCLQVWDVQAQESGVRQCIIRGGGMTTSLVPVFWTTKDKSIVAAFSFFTWNSPKTINEFDASTLKTVGAPFEGHTSTINGLALSSDCVLLASSSLDQTIKLWSFQSRQLLASFDVQNSVQSFIFSPNSRQLAYSTSRETKIYICNIPANILASVGLAEGPQPSL